MKMYKRGIAWILALMLALSIAPSVFAAEGDESGTQAPKYIVHNPKPINEDGLYMDKQLAMNNDGTGTITLEVYATKSIETLNTNTAIQDIVSEHFVVNGVVDDINTDIKAYQGNGTFRELDQKELQGMDIRTVVIGNEGQVRVYGFDFDPVTEGSDENPASGKKMIIEIPVKLTDKAKEAYAGREIPSNNRVNDKVNNKAAIINGTNIIKEFGVPTVELPAIELTVQVWGNEKTVTYNGEEQYVEGFTASELPDGLTFELKKEAKATGTDPGTYMMGLTADDFVISGENLYRYDITVEVVKDGSLTIKPIEAAAKADNNTDKTAKTGDDFQIGLIAGVALLALAGAGTVLFTRRKKTN